MDNLKDKDIEYNDYINNILNNKNDQGINGNNVGIHNDLVSYKDHLQGSGLTESRGGPVSEESTEINNDLPLPAAKKCKVDGLNYLFLFLGYLVSLISAFFMLEGLEDLDVIETNINYNHDLDDFVLVFFTPQALQKTWGETPRGER